MAVESSSSPPSPLPPVIYVALDSFFASQSLTPSTSRFKSPPLHDPLAVAYVIAPEIFTLDFMRVDIETKSELSRYLPPLLPPLFLPLFPHLLSPLLPPFSPFLPPLPPLLLCSPFSTFLFPFLLPHFSQYRGQTVCDVYKMSKKPKNVHLARKVDVAAFWKLMMEAWRKCNAVSSLNKK